MRTILLLSLGLLLSAACQTSGPKPARERHERVPFVGGDEASRALGSRFLGAQTPDVIRPMRPTRAELGVLFDAPTADALDAHYAKLWSGPDLGRIPAIPKDTTITISAASADELLHGKPPFPRDYARVARHLKPSPSLPLLSLRFQSGGLDMSFDAFVDMGAGRWVFLPTAWKGLPPE